MKTKKPRIKKAKPEIYIDQSPSEEAPRVSKKGKVPNMENLYKIVGNVSQVERDMKSLTAYHSNLNQMRKSAELELHLLQVHINRVSRELDTLERFESEVYREASRRFSHTAHAMRSLVEASDEQDEFRPLLEELQAQSERELKNAALVAKPHEAMVRFKRILADLRSLQSLQVPPVEPPVEFNQALDNVKTAHLDQLVKWESKLAKRYDNSRPL